MHSQKMVLKLGGGANLGQEIKTWVKIGFEYLYIKINWDNSINSSIQPNNKFYPHQIGPSALHSQQNEVYEKSFILFHSFGFGFQKTN